jgi:hypothetical protein
MDFESFGISLKDIQESLDDPGWYWAPIAREELKAAYKALREAGYKVSVELDDDRWKLLWMPLASDLLKSGVIHTIVGEPPSGTHSKASGA